MQPLVRSLQLAVLPTRFIANIAMRGTCLLRTSAKLVLLFSKFRPFLDRLSRNQVATTCVHLSLSPLLSLPLLA